MPGHVLVGIDGSDASFAALRWAAWYATTTKRELQVAHAWQRSRWLVAHLAPTPSDVTVLEAEVEKLLEAATREHVGDDVDIAAHLALRGEPADVLARRAVQDGANVLVVGARGSGGASRLLLGSVSRALTECPSHTVAVVPDSVQLPSRTPWEIVVGIDGSDGASRAMRWALDAAQRGGGDVVAVHAFTCAADTPPDEEQFLLEETRRRLTDEWCAPLRFGNVAHRVVIERADARVLLQAIVDSTRPACLVLGSRGLGPVSSKLLGSVTADAVRHIECPTVIVPSARDCIYWGT